MADPKREKGELKERGKLRRSFLRMLRKLRLADVAS